MYIFDQNKDPHFPKQVVAIVNSHQNSILYIDSTS